MLASTVRGTRTAISSTRSHEPVSKTSSITLVTIDRTSGSSARTAFGVNAVWRILRYFVWSSGSL